MDISKQIINGKILRFNEVEEIYSWDLYDLLHQANIVRKHFKGDNVKLCSIVNAKSGACSEDCSFCAQSAKHKAATSVYPLTADENISSAISDSETQGASCFGIVTSGNKITKNEIKKICNIVKRENKRNIKLSASLGEIDKESLEELKASGLKKYHHNLETAESFFPNICTTHSFKDRFSTVIKAKEAGLEVCCGGILGIGETVKQRIELAFTLKELNVDSIPLNFLHPIPGTPLANQKPMSPHEILRTIAIFRLVLSDKDISVCGGRTVNLRDLQSWIFYAGANGMMVGGYLNNPGSPDRAGFANDK